MWILIAVTALSMVVCNRVAAGRGADKTFWTVLALLIGPLAIPFVFFSKPKA